jgi:putative transposase
MTLYEHGVGTLNRKSGITYKQFKYKGDNLAPLIERYGEVAVNYLVDPDDYRFIFVNEGSNEPLVPLKEEFVSDVTPAYSFAQKLEQMRQEKALQAEAPEKTNYRKGVQEASLPSATGRSDRRPTKAERNKAVADKAKQAQAVQRAIQKPVGTTESGSTINPVRGKTVSFADAPSLPVLNRETGREQT